VTGPGSTGGAAAGAQGRVSSAANRLKGFVRGDDLDLSRRDGGVEVRLTGIIVLVGTLASTLFHLALALFTDREWPYTTFLFNPEGRFSDFLEIYVDAQQYGHNGHTNLVYSGVLHLLTLALTALPSVVGWLLVNAVFMTTLVLVVWFGVTARTGGRRVRDAYVLVFCLLAYPVLMMVDRANLEMVVFVLLAAFVYLYYARRSAWAWVPLSLAIAGKYYWAVLLVLLLTDRQWRQLALTALGAVAVTIASAAALGVASGLGFVGVLLSTFSTLNGHLDLANSPTAVKYAHSFFAIPYFIDRSSGYWLQIHLDYMTAYTALALTVFALVVVRLVLYEVEAWRKLTALIICAIALPFESHDYTMVHLLLPLALLGAWGAKSERGRLYSVLFGLLLVPLDYVYFGFQVKYSSLAYAILLLSLLVSVLTDGVRVRTVPLWRAGRAGPEA
jgi:hypothetical protein